MQHLIPKFIHNKQRYPELAIFDHFEYSFKDNMTLSQVPGELAEMFNIHDHTLQVIFVVAGSTDLGMASKAANRASARDMITDVNVVWSKACPNPVLKLGLFVSLIPPKLWYSGFIQQKAGRDTRRSINSHLRKITRQQNAIVVPHHLITAEEKWFHDLRSDPLRLSEPGYDIILQDLCLCLSAKLQFSVCLDQRAVTLAFFHGQAPLLVASSPTKKSKKSRRSHKKCF